MEQKIKKKKKTPRCNYKDCRKKLKLTDFKCPACKLKFCNKHRYYSDHNCEKYEEYNKGPAFRCNACGCPGFKFMLRGSICPHKKPKWR